MWICVFFCGWWMNSLYESSLSFSFSLDRGYLFLSLFFDMPCGHVAYLLWVCLFYFRTCWSMWHTFFGYASFISFCIAPYPWCHFLMREMSYGNMEFLIGGCMSGYVANFQCRSVACGSGHVCDLDHWSMKWISLRVTAIWQSSIDSQNWHQPVWPV